MKKTRAKSTGQKQCGKRNQRLGENPRRSAGRKPDAATRRRDKKNPPPTRGKRAGRENARPARKQARGTTRQTNHDANKTRGQSNRGKRRTQSGNDRASKGRRRGAREQGHNQNLAQKKHKGKKKEQHTEEKKHTRPAQAGPGEARHGASKAGTKAETTHRKNPTHHARRACLLSVGYSSLWSIRLNSPHANRGACARRSTRLCRAVDHPFKKQRRLK